MTLTRSTHAADRAVRLEAQRLDGRDCLGFNLYRPAVGRAWLKPGEAAAETVRRFVGNPAE